jgi:hypothetical protein
MPCGHLKYFPGVDLIEMGGGSVYEQLLGLRWVQGKILMGPWELLNLFKKG